MLRKGKTWDCLPRNDDRSCLCTWYYPHFSFSTMAQEADIETIRQIGITVSNSFYFVLYLSSFWSFSLVHFTPQYKGYLGLQIVTLFNVLASSFSYIFIRIWLQWKVWKFIVLLFRFIILSFICHRVYQVNLNEPDDAVLVFTTDLQQAEREKSLQKILRYISFFSSKNQYFFHFSLASNPYLIILICLSIVDIKCKTNNL